jgi:DNA-binding phage protein
MSKARPNRLDPFASRLEEWEAEGKTLAQMLEGLRADGCVSSRSALSDYLARRRALKLEQELFATIASGGRMNRELDAAFKENPSPAVERLIEITKTLVMSLQVKGAADPDLLKLANSMQQTVLNYMSGVTKAALEERKLTLSESKYRDQVQERVRKMEAEIAAAKSSGGITTETLEKIERELKLF